MLYELQKEKRLQIHIIQDMLDDLSYWDYEAAGALAEYARKRAIPRPHAHDNDMAESPALGSEGP